MDFFLRDSNNNFDHSLKNSFHIGRSSDADIVIDSPKVSKLHCFFEYDDIENLWYITDLNSTNGTFLNNEKLSPNERVKLPINSKIKVFNTEFTLIKKNITKRIEREFGDISLEFGNTIKIGRASDNDIVIESPLSSRYHAEISVINGKATIKDLNSKNGVFVNGTRINRHSYIEKSDVINIADTKITFSGIDSNEKTQIRFLNQKNNLTFDVVDISKTVIDKNNTHKNLLSNISFNVKRGEFVVVLGGSGAGKSTLLDALNGFRPANNGKIYVNGKDYYKNLDVFKPILGYVPQKDIVHEELTVFEEIDFAAKLRLDLDPTERKQKVESVIASLDLTKRKDIPIKDLSGGQKKRVSIGIELLSEPSLFFLDEPTSGLDPATERDLMSLMKDMASEGKIVFLITHAITNLNKATHILFLGNEGRVVYFGPSSRILDYFQVADISDIYDLVKDPKDSELYRKKYLESTYYNEYVFKRDEKRKLDSQEKEVGHNKGKNNTNYIFQYLTLTSRYATTVWKDKGSLFIQLLQAPIIAILICFAFDLSIFNAEAFRSKTISPLLLFILSSISIWFGTSNSAQEIVKEIDIYKRERMINLKIVPYILSKLSILSIISIIQCLIILIIVSYAFNINSDYFVEILITLFLGAFSGNTLGLLISSISLSKEMAVVIVPLVLIPQIMFSGAITKISDMNDAGKVISYITMNKWVYHALGDITSRNKFICDDTKNNKVPPEELGGCGEDSDKRKFFNKDFNNTKNKSWLILIFMSILFLILSIIATLYREIIISSISKLKKLFSLFS